MPRVPCSTSSLVAGARQSGSSRPAAHTKCVRPVAGVEDLRGTVVVSVRSLDDRPHEPSRPLVEVDEHLANHHAVGERHDPVFARRGGCRRRSRARAVRSKRTGREAPPTPPRDERRLRSHCERKPLLLGLFSYGSLGGSERPHYGYCRCERQPLSQKPTRRGAISPPVSWQHTL